MKFKMEYTNDIGTIVFGGGYENSIVKVLAAEGLGLPGKQYETVEFASENGVTQVGEKDIYRTITLSCELSNGYRSDKERINRILHNSGELYCYFDECRRKIQCKCTRMPEFVHKGAGFYTFTIQFQADYPYFTDFHRTETPLYTLKNLVTTSFQLPWVFTKRLNDADILNDGDKYIYPEIIITVSGQPQGTDNILTIRNDTTEKFIKINHVIADNEVVTIDLKTRKITSSISGIITNKISDDTNLSEFYLKPGKNHIFFGTTDETQALHAVAVYSPEYYSCEV